MTAEELKTTYSGVVAGEANSPALDVMSKKEALEKIEEFFTKVDTDNNSKYFDELHEIIKIMDHFGDEARKSNHVLTASFIVGAHINDMKASRGKMSEVNRLAQIVKAQELYKAHKSWLSSFVFKNEPKNNTGPN